MAAVENRRGRKESIHSRNHARAVVREIMRRRPTRSQRLYQHGRGPANAMRVEGVTSAMG